MKLNYHLDSLSGWIEISYEDFKRLELQSLSGYTRIGENKVYLEEYSCGDVLIKRLKDLNISYEIIPIWDGESSFIRGLSFLK